MNKKRLGIVLASIIGMAVVLFAVWNAYYEIVERTDVKPSPKPDDGLSFVDDKLTDKQPIFDAELVDRRDYEGWDLNQSSAVIRLDCPDIRGDREPRLLQVHANYQDAARVAEELGREFLPSANLLDGLAKQFDDGLYAALDLACFRGDANFTPSAVRFTRQTFDALPEQSVARPFLAAALQLANQPVELTDEESQISAEWISKFESNRLRSTPISFYTWNQELRSAWKYFRFLQHRFGQTDLAIPLEIRSVIDRDEALSRQYDQLIAFYSGLSNPPGNLHLHDLEGTNPNLAQLASKVGRQIAAVSILPPSTSRETELFNRLYPDGSTAQANLMIELIRRVRSGDIDLSPRGDSGWYDQQVFALETLVLPERGAEHEKLLLTSKYKRRLVQAFQALITKRRETHARQLVLTDAAMAMPPEEIKPRLRIEPCATFYLRTARSYAFLQSFLQSQLDPATLGELHGLRADGEREPDLSTELESMQQLFYGFYLVVCDDIGMKPDISADEKVDVEAAYRTAVEWLDQTTHPDLAIDTRIAVPIAYDPQADESRLWATIGIRLAKLDASYARSPHYRENADAPWEEVESMRLGKSRYVIAVDEFAEFSLPGGNVMTREQLRNLCDQHATKAEIVRALSR